MIINPNDSEFKTFLKSWNEKLKERQTKIMTLHTQYQNEMKTFQDETTAFNAQFSEKTGMPANQEHLLTEILLTAIDKA
jgi:hydrogenase maturation factor